MTMQQYRGLQRLADTCLRVQRSRYVCNSCRTQIAASQERQLSVARTPKNLSQSQLGRRQFGTSSGLRATTDITASDNTSVASEDPSSDPDYVPARTWDDLETIGGDKWVEKLHDKGDRYTRWAVNQIKVPSAEKLMRPILKEILSFRLNNGYGGDRSTRQQYKDTLKSLEDKETVLKRSTLSLEDHKLKFEILKLVYKQRPNRLPDHTAQGIKTVGALVRALETRPAPRSVAEQISQSRELEALPNITISKKRITPITKEKQLGRWKVIKQELKERGLPVVGVTTRVKQSFVTE